MAFYQHNPYISVLRDASLSPCPSPEPSRDALPIGTLHDALIGEVNYIPYPTTVPADDGAYIPPKDQLERVFVGQLPYTTLIDQAEWVVKTATGCAVFHTEIIHGWTNGQAPKGCVHTYCFAHDLNRIRQMNKRVLVDDTGIWVAEDELQSSHLRAYCAAMKADKHLRFPNRPFQAVVLEGAKSTFRPRDARGTHATSSPQPQTLPPQYTHHPYSGGYCTPPPPPAYGETVGYADCE